MKMESSSVVGFDDEGTEEDLDGNVSKKKSLKKSGGFRALGLSNFVLKGLKTRGYKQPTPIQRKCIPLILEGRDVVAMARTGSGKTACFLVPLFERLLKPKAAKLGGVRSLILTPTRELAIQTLRFIRELGKFTRLRAVVVLGGDSMDQQFGALHGDPDIVVATPGRFLHICVEMDLNLKSVEYVVFDEADRLFEMGFGEQLQEILNRLPEFRQTVLFSATLPKLLVNFARAGLSDPALIRLDVESKLPDTLDLAFLAVRSEDKLAALLSLLQALPENKQTLVFLATKHHVEYCHMILERAGISNTFIYSDLDASARKINAAKFQNGIVSVLLVTDVAARGVDIPQLDYVINYHFPAKAKLFVHRVGRCARAGRTGTAFSFACSEECPYVLDLHLFLGRPVNLLLPGTQPKSNESVFGKIPESVIEAEQSRVMIWHETVAELVSMQKVCNNGYKKYLRSRPGASAESVKRMRDIDMSKLAVHPFFASLDSEESSARELLDQMKSYKPRGTIFELNVSAKAKSYAVMKTTKKVHEKSIEAFKTKKAAKNEAMAAQQRNLAAISGETLPAGEEEIENAFSTVIMGKRKMSTTDGGPKKKKKKEFVDRENYIPHLAPDRHTEEGLSVNSFSAEAHKVGFDLTDDTEKRLAQAKKLMKWDKKKKKMVGVESEKAGKIKTESGAWISKSFKTNRYKEWKERSKIVENANNSDDEDEKPVRRQKKDIPNTHWARHNLKMAVKQKSKIGLRRPEQILKSRKEREKKRLKSLPKNKKSSGGRRRK